MWRVPDTRIQLDQTKTISEHSCADEKTWLGLWVTVYLCMFSYVSLRVFLFSYNHLFGLEPKHRDAGNI